MNVIEVENVTKVFFEYKKGSDALIEALSGKKKHTEFVAIDNVSFNVKLGEAYGILGGNGSGKSTIINMINGVTYPTSGEIRTRGIVSLFNVRAGMNPQLTGERNIYHKCALMGLSKKYVEKIKDDIIKFSEVGDFLERPVKNYSSGMVAKLGFSIAVHAAPEILIVDEGLAVGDSRFAEKCHNKMHELRKKGLTILYVSHSHGAVRNFCTKAAWINNGEFIGEGSPNEMSKIYEKFMAGKITLEEAKEDVAKHMQERNEKF